MNLVLIAGIKRSASTAQWNLVRLALQMAGYGLLLRGHSFDVQELNDLSGNEIILCKRHPFSKPLAKAADHIFLTDRNDKDILKSLDRMWDSGDPERLERMRAELDKWKEYTDDKHMFKYDLLINAPYQYGGRIIDVLGVDVDLMELMDKFNKIEPPEEKQNPVTRLFPEHIS